MSDKFQPKSAQDIRHLISEHPLAWMISRDFQATPLPLLAETNEKGAIVALLGHFALRNPQINALQKDPRALILFNGPHQYISPTHVSNPSWGPTWNYAVVRYEVDIDFVPLENEAALHLLVGHLEKEGGWSISEMGDRYDELADHIIAFRAHVRSCQATFKLGQDENPETVTEIIKGLEDHLLAQWMKAQQLGSPPE